MAKPSARIAQMSESETLAMAKKARELKAAGIDVISLSLGEPDFDTPDFIKDAAREALDLNLTHYPPVNGMGELREAISLKFKRDNNLDYDPNQIVVSTGAKQSLMNIVMCVLNPGDELLLPAPYWVSYKAMGEMAEAKITEIPTTVESDYKISAAQLDEALNQDTKLMMFSSPCNPSGSVYSYDELAAMADVIEKYPNLLVVCDEIYELIQFGGEHHSLASFDKIKDQVITVNGVAKGFAMTGWRIGYMAGPQWLANACSKLQGQFTSGANSIAQWATKAAVEADPSRMDYMKEAFAERREFVAKQLSNMPGLIANNPTGAFYFFPDVSAFFGKRDGDREIKDSADLCAYLLDEAQIALVPGSAFGSPNCLRISYATSLDQLEKAMNQMQSALAKLK